MSKEDRKWVFITVMLILLWFTGILIFIKYSEIENLIVRSDGSIAKGSRVAGRVHYYLAPKLQGAEFWKNQLRLAKQKIEKEKNHPEKLREQIRQKVIDFQQSTSILTKMFSEKLAKLTGIEYQNEKKFQERIIANLKNDFDKEIKSLEEAIKEHPQRLQELYEIQLVIANKLSLEMK